MGSRIRREKIRPTYVSGVCSAPPTAIFRVKLQIEQDGAIGSLNLC
jgi:hypothetical protein